MQATGALTLDLISSAEARTLPGLFLRRCERSPEAEAYRQYDPATGTWQSYRWREMKALAGRWRAALARENLAPGERVAILLRNSVEWVCFDQAAQSLGLAVVPLYVTDNPENIAYILRDSDARAPNLADAGTVDHRKRPPHADSETEAPTDRAALRARDPGTLCRASGRCVNAVPLFPSPVCGQSSAVNEESARGAASLLLLMYNAVEAEGRAYVVMPASDGDGNDLSRILVGYGPGTGNSTLQT